MGHSLAPHQPLRPLKTLQPAPPRIPTPPPPPPTQTTFLSLPPEIRNQIYELAFQSTTLHILPLPLPHAPRPHPLTLTTRQIRLETLPLLHSTRPLRAKITNFNFAGLLTWLARMTPANFAQTLAKNGDLKIWLVVTGTLPGDLPTLRRWLHLRADVHRDQAGWVYEGRMPERRLWPELRRRVNRMKREEGKRRELLCMLEALKVGVGVGGGGRRGRTLGSGLGSGGVSG